MVIFCNAINFTIQYILFCSRQKSGIINTTLSTLSVQRLNHAVNQVVNAMPGSSSGVDTESDQLNVSANNSSACMSYFNHSVIYTVYVNIVLYLHTIILVETEGHR